MEFYIDGMVNGSSGYLSIVGRCGTTPIKRGDEFHAMFLEKKRDYPHGLDQPSEIERCKHLDLTVAEIESHGKVLDSLTAFMTGVLRCKVESDLLLPAGWILTDRCPSKHVEELSAATPALTS